MVGIRFDIANNPSIENQTTLDGLSLKESVDTHSDIKSLPVYKMLLKHGVSERLAIRMLAEEGEERMQQLVRYTEEKNRQRTIKSTGAYIKKLVDDKAIVGETEFQKEAKQKKQQAVQQELEAQNKSAQEAEQRKQHINSVLDHFDTLSEEQKNSWRKEYELSCPDITRKLFQTGGERSPVHRMRFAEFVESKLQE